MAGELIDGQYAIPKQGTTTPTVTKTPTYNPQATGNTSYQQPAPQVYWFMGRKYTSYASYAAAVNAYRQQVEYASTLRKQQAAAAAAARRAYQLAQQRARWMSAERARQRLVAEAERRRKELVELERRQREIALAAKRRIAYDALRRRLKEQQAAALNRRREQAQRTLEQETKQIKDRVTSQQVATRDQQQRLADTYAAQEGGIKGRGGSRIRLNLLRDARNSGDYMRIFEFIEDRARRTGGRYLDQKLYETAVTEYQQRVDRVSTEYSALADKINDLAQAGDYDSALALMESDEWREHESRISQLLGDGRKPGEVNRLAELTQSIGRYRDEYLERVILQQYAGNGRELLTPTEVRLARERIAGELGQTGQKSRRDPEGDGLLTLRQWGDIQYRTQQHAAQRFAEMSMRDKFSHMNRQSPGSAPRFVPKVGWVMTDKNGQSWKLRQGVDPFKGGEWNAEAFVPVGAEQGMRHLSEVMGSSRMRRVEALEEQLRNGSPIERRRAQRELTILIEEGADAYFRKLGSKNTSLGPAPNVSLGTRYMPSQADIQDQLRSQNRRAKAKEDLVAQMLGYFGLERPGGLVGGLDKISRAPVLGELLGGLDLARSAVWSTLWDARVALHGRDSLGTVELPTVYFRDGRMFIGQEDATTGENRPLDLTQAWDYSNQDEMQEIYDEYRRIMDDPSSTPEERMEAILLMGSSGRTGNSMLLFDAATDPLSVLGVGRFYRAGQLALGEAGGLRAALGQFKPGGLKSLKMPTLAPVLQDFGKFATPAWFGPGGTLRLAETTKATVYRHIAQGMNLSVPEVKALGLPQLRDALQRLAKGQPIDEVRAALPGLDRALEGKRVNTQQLVAFAEAEIKRQAGKVILPSQMRHQIQEAIRQRDLADAQLKQLTEISEANLARQGGAEALAAVRAEMAAKGVKAAPELPAEVKPRGGQVAKLNRLRGEVERLMSERAELARQTAEVAERFLRKEVHDAGFRQLDLRKLEDGLRRLSAYRDVPEILPNGTRKTQPGLVTQAQENLRQYRRSLGLAEVERPSYSRWFDKRWADDNAFINTQVQFAQQMKSAAKSKVQRQIWEGRLAKLQAARDGLRIERELSQKGRGVARRIMQKYGDVATKRFSPNRVARPALSEQAAHEEFLREVHVRIATSEVEPEPRQFTAAETGKGERAWETLYSAPIRTKTPELAGLKADVGDMTLGEAIDVIRQISASPAGFTVYEDTLKSLLAEAKALTRLEPEFLTDYADLGHSRWGRMVSLDQYRDIDRQVRSAIVTSRRGRRRKGSERAASGGARSPETGAFVLTDSDAVAALAKSRMVRRLGMTVREYDEMRSVLGDLSRRDNVTRSFAKKANGDVERFDNLRAARQRKEAFHDLEEFANQPHLAGMTDEAVWALWQSEHSLDDLAPAPRILTNYQKRVLEAVWTEKFGRKVGDSHMTSRLLGGHLRAPKGSRLAKKGEFGGIADDYNIPIFVVEVPDAALVEQGLGALTPAQRVLYKADGTPIHGASVQAEGIYLWEGTGQVTFHHELAHTFIDSQRLTDPHNIFDMYAQAPQGFLDKIYEMVGGPGRNDNVFDLNELLAEAYALYKTGAELRIQGHHFSWERVRLTMTTEPERLALRVLEDEFDRLAHKISLDESWGFGTNHPPFGNRARMRDWLVENGFWSPKTAEDIAAGRRVWNIEDERKFWEANYAYTPPWTDPEVLRPLLDNPEEYFSKFREWGFFDDDFELLAASANKAMSAGDRMVFGADGVKAARSLEEMREWFVSRYGELVSPDGGKTFTAVPWLMDFDEYTSWFGRMGESVDTLKNLGLSIDQTLVGPVELGGLAGAMRKAVSKHMERVREAMKREGMDPDTWLPEERKRLAYDVVDELLSDRSWMTLLDKSGLVDRAMLIGQLQRLFIVWTPAFPIMNAIDSFGPKAALLSIMKNRGRWIYSTEDHWDDLVPDLAAVGDTLTPTWGTAKYNPLLKIGDTKYSAAEQLGAMGQVIVQAPLTLSAKAEGVLRLNFARSVAGRTYDDLIRTGMDADTAAMAARLEAHRALKTFFSVLDSAPAWEKILNQIVPFFTYTYKNGLMGLRIITEAPWIASLGQRLGMYIEGMNRRNWEQEHPGEEFPENVDAQRLWLETPWGRTYTIDLGMFSDWTRAMKALADPERPLFGPEGVFRVPHPWQTALFGLFTGQPTVWGAEANIANLTPWFEFFDYAFGGKWEEFDENDPKSKDVAQIISQLLFFKAFGRVTPMATKVQSFFALMQVDEDAAWKYYNENPDVRAYFQRDGIRPQSIFDTKKWSWHAFASDERIAEYNRAMSGLDRIHEYYDQQAEKFYMEPWSREYRDLKLERRTAVAAYIKSNPLLEEVWTWSRANRWAEEADAFRTDLLVEEFFEIKAPRRADFDTDLAYLEAQQDYYARRERYLEQNPTVYDTLYNSHNAVEAAWFQHELQWSEILQDQAAIRIQIAQEDAKLDPDRDKLDLLYRISDMNYRRLDQEALGAFYGDLDVEVIQNQPTFVSNILNRGLGRVRQLVAMPGRADFFYEIADDRERLQIVEDEKYFTSLGDLMSELKQKDDFSTFWTEMKKRGLLDRYLKENPNKRIDYDYAMNISRIFAAGAPIKFWDRLMAEPTWLNEYLRRNPDKQATYQKILVGKRYFNEMQALWGVIGDDFTRFYDELAKRPWLQQQYFARNPEKAGSGRGMSAYGIAISAIFDKAKDGRDFYRLLSQNPELMAEYFRRHPDRFAKYQAGSEYFRHISNWVEALKRNDTDGAQRLWDAMPDWVHERYFERHPDSGMQTAQAGGYAAAMGRWVELLRSGEYVEADKYFKGLPTWMQERYFQKHPDQRAKHELTSEMLQLGAEYFLASDGDKAKVLARSPQLAAWLKEHGGNESAWRGLIFAIYRALPSGEGAWLKRKFRESYPELFGQEAQGERRLQRVAKRLAENPEMLPFYEKALAIQTQLYTEQLKLQKTPPKPLTMERKSRLLKRRKRRSARLHSRWSTHQRLRKM